jgi:tRNA threonylcarbamoyladenosine biosynthesis protein TsaB
MTALLAEVERAAAAAGGWDGVGAIAVGVGPGSFTGLRVGVATARALGLSRGLPVGGVSTLDAVGRAIGESHPGLLRLAVLDARRGETFGALYSEGGERIVGPLVAPPDEIAELAAEGRARAVGAGSGAVRFRAELTHRGIEVPDDDDPVHRVAARHICSLAAVAGGVDDAGPVAPIYLRPPDAERWRERDTVKEVE